MSIGIDIGLALKKQGAGTPPPPDVTPPAVSSFNPADNAVGISLSTNLVVVFNEFVALGTGNITLKRTLDNVTIEAWDVATEQGTGPGQVNVVGGTELTMRLTSPLVYSIEYYVIWDAGVVKDAANNNCVANASTTLWSFTTTADVTGPIVTSFSPLDNATDVPINATLVATFNEPVMLGGGGITLRKSSDDSGVETWSVTTEVGSGPGQVEVVGGTQLTMHLTSNLLNNTEYYVTWQVRVVEDLVGNDVAPITSKTAWSFTTVAAASTYAPTYHVFGF